MGRMVHVVGIGGAAPQQEGLFGGVGFDGVAEPVLMALHAEYYALMWQGLKTHEFRRRFLEGRATRWFVYLNAPVSRLAAVIDLGPAVVDAPEQIAAIAERAQARLVRNWTLENVVEEIDLRTSGGHSGVTPSMVSGWELGWHTTQHRAPQDVV